MDCTGSRPSPMLKSFEHKGLEALQSKGDASGVKAEHLARLRRLHSLLDAAAVPADLDRPGYRCQPLKWLRSVSHLGIRQCR